MSVDLFLVRHAIAAERGPEWPDDNKRPLTEKGVARFRESVDGLVWLDLGIEIILTSSLVRAKQTAEYLASGIGSKPPIKVIEALAPGHAPVEVMEQTAREAKSKTRVALVGHEPDLGELLAHLVGAKRAIPFKKGGVCRIEMDSFASKGGSLACMLTPKMLRKLGQ